MSKPSLTTGSIEIRGLAEGLLVFGGGIADVVTDLSTTDETLVRVYLVGLWNGVRKVINNGRKRDVRGHWATQSALKRGASEGRCQ